MKISYKWLKELIDVNYTPEEIDNILTMLGIEVEAIEDFSKKYDKFVVAKVLEKEKHPDADKLSVCTVEYAGTIQTVVCGAPNVDKGQTVVLGLEGAVVPSANFTLVKRKIRGIESNGMICSQTELELGEDSSGIWVLPNEVESGISLASYLGLDDVVFEIGITPNKAECLSHLGVARELAAYSGKTLTLPSDTISESLLLKEDLSNESTSQNLQIEILDSEKCPRYVARIVKNVKIAESPDWLKTKLTKAGLRSINNVVDVTNYILLELGQPLHAFDYDKVSNNKIIVRTANTDSNFKTLDDKDRVLDENMLVICDSDKALAVAGVMGGANSEINDQTTNILIESAFFSPTSIRKTAKKLGIQSDASYRFERGVDINILEYAANRAAIMIAEISGGRVSKDLIDVYPVKFVAKKITTKFEKCRDLVGLTYSNDEILELASKLFEINSKDNEKFEIIVPSYRHDMDYDVDVIEDIARLYNYDNIEADYNSNINFASAELPSHLTNSPIKKQLENYLVNAGFNQILTQNMIDLNAALNFANRENLAEIANPLGEELAIMRPSLVPSTLKVISKNIRNGNSSCRLFEIAKSFKSEIVKSKNNLQFLEGFSENEELIIAFTGKAQDRIWHTSKRDFDFYDIKGIFESICSKFNWSGILLETINSKESHLFEIMSKNTLTIKMKGQNVGYFGSPKMQFLKKFDISQDVFVLNINLSAIYQMKHTANQYTKVSPYPSSERDLAFVIDSSIESGKMMKSIVKSGGSLLKNVNIFDVYQGKGIEEGKKSIAFSLTFADSERTLVEEEIESSVQNIIKNISKEFSAILRSN